MNMQSSDPLSPAKKTLSHKTDRILLLLTYTVSYSLLPHPKKHNKSNVCQVYQQPLDDIVMGPNC